MDNYSNAEIYQDLAKVPGQVQDPAPACQELALAPREEDTIALKDEEKIEQREQTGLKLQENAVAVIKTEQQLKQKRQAFQKQVAAYMSADRTYEDAEPLTQKKRFNRQINLHYDSNSENLIFQLDLNLQPASSKEQMKPEKQFSLVNSSRTFNLKRVRKVVEIKIQIKLSQHEKQVIQAQLHPNNSHCIFFPKCKKEKTCPFLHTGIICSNYPNCSHKKLCKFYHMSVVDQKSFFYSKFVDLLEQGYTQTQIPKMKKQIKYQFPELRYDLDKSQEKVEEVPEINPEEEVRFNEEGRRRFRNNNRGYHQGYNHNRINYRGYNHGYHNGPQRSGYYYPRNIPLPPAPYRKTYKPEERSNRQTNDDEQSKERSKSKGSNTYQYSYNTQNNVNIQGIRSNIETNRYNQYYNRSSSDQSEEKQQPTIEVKNPNRYESKHSHKSRHKQHKEHKEYKEPKQHREHREHKSHKKHKHKHRRSRSPSHSKHRHSHKHKI